MHNRYNETRKIGKNGAFTIPAPLRRCFGFEEGSLIIAEERKDGILLRPAIEAYSNERIAEFLLSSAADTSDYIAACADVAAIGIDPNSILHRKP